MLSSVVFKPMAKCVVLVVALAMMPFAVSVSYAAKKPEIKTASLTPGKIPFKKTNLMVLGDSLGDGVWAGLYNAFRKNKNIKVTRKSKPSTGFVRVDYYDWNANLKQILTKNKIDVAVIMMGANDRQTIITKAGRHKPGSKRWREIYASRVDVFTRQLKAHGAKVYWVGLPITRRKRFTRHMKILNGIFADRARANKITFVDIWKDFTTAKGGYSAHGKDISGRVRKLRANDGVHFTMRGYRKLAFAAERYIRAEFAKNARPVVVARVAKKPLKTEPKKGKPVRKPPVVVQALKPALKKPEKAMKVAAIAPELLMMRPEFSPAPIAPQIMKIRKKTINTVIVTKALPEFRPDTDYLAKNLQKTRITDVGITIRQALANDFQGILSIVQPDKAVVVTDRPAYSPNQEMRASKNKVLPQRQQMVKTATLRLSTDVLQSSEKTKVAPRVVGSVRPVSIESGTPDDKVEYEDKRPFGQQAFTSIASVFGLDFATISDAEGALTTIVYRTLLRGDAVSPKAGRGDDFSWPRD